MKIAVQKTAGRTAKAFFKEGQLWIKIPFFLKSEEESRILEKFQNWGIKQVTKYPHLLHQPAQQLLENGDRITVRNKNFSLYLNSTKHKSIHCRIFDQILEIHHPKSLTPHLEIMQKHIARAFSQYFIEEIQSRVCDINSNTFNVKIKEVRLKYIHSRWGSCSSQGNINLSSRLLLAPEEVMDYVIVHELAHRKEMNHSDRFWKLIEAGDPEFRKKEEWLKKNGRICDFIPQKSDHI